MKKTTLFTLTLLVTLLMPILCCQQYGTEASVIPESDWIKLTDHSQGADSSSWSPDGSEIVYNTWDNAPQGAVYRMKADGTSRTNLGIVGVQYPHVSPDGSGILTVGFGYVWISNYDGSNHHYIYGVYDSGSGVSGSCHHCAAWSPAGERIVVPEYTYIGSGNPRSHIVTINPDGTNPTILTNDELTYLYPCWSPDGEKIAFQKTDHSAMKSDIWIMDSDGLNQNRITYFEDAMFPVWSPDGSSIFFIRRYGSSSGQYHIYRMDTDGSDVIQLTSSDGEWFPAISPDGKWMSFTAFDENGVRNIYKTKLKQLVIATIDIDPNALNLNSNGEMVTGYIELPAGYDVNDIGVSSILLNDTVPAQPGLTNIADHDNDGIPDLMVKFNRTEVILHIIQNANLKERFTTITLAMKGTCDETPFQGTDTIKAVMPMPKGASKGTYSR